MVILVNFYLLLYLYWVIYFIIFMGLLVNITFICYASFLLIKRINNIKINNKYFENKFAKEFFKADFLNINIGPLGILFVYGFYKNIDLFNILVIASSFLSLLLVLSSNKFLDWLLKMQQFIVLINKTIDDIFNSLNNDINLNKSNNKLSFKF
nr:hypothetical protein [Grifola frondosa]